MNGIRIESGEPTPEELAALLAVLHTLANQRVGNLPADTIRPAPWAHQGHTHRPARVWGRTA
ncbi:acyl-CoA carboxylase subunit epsilon [Streptomyces sp. NPDC006314]|uniref:acyl-CoA carboxylase subunit epsilon n=1 Tax=Streptomyces sp. NPDC006314 TaxID=3154475 RepID=UPI0033AE3CE0